MTRTPNVAIIGGGIGGIAAALAFHQRGIEAQVYEQSAELKEIGAGLNLSPNAMKALRTLGLENEILDVACPVGQMPVRNYRSGRVIMRQERAGRMAERYGAAFVTIHRADLLDALSHALPEQFVHLGAACTSIETDDNAAVARFADGRKIEADIVIGADGIHSTVRDSLFGQIEPHFWRGMVAVDRIPNADEYAQSTIWWGPHGHVVHYPVRRGELINFVAHIDSDAWTEESWINECDVSELLETYAGWHDNLLRLFETSDKYYKMGIVRSRPARQMDARPGNLAWRFGPPHAALSRARGVHGSLATT